MSRSTLIILRVLAVGGALTAVACHVWNRQQQANTGAIGERGGAGAEAGPTTTRRDWAPSSKIGTVVRINNFPSDDVSTDNSRELRPSPGSDVHILGTKSAAVVSPLDVQNLLPDPLEGQRLPANPPPPVLPATSPPRFHGTKYGRVIAPEELRQMQQRAAPAQQSAPAQP